jgi:subtilisin family serine protease
VELDEYMVLRTVAAAGMVPAGAKVRGGPPETPAATNVRVDSYALDAQEIKQLRQRGDVEGLAPVLPLKLAAPRNKVDARLPLAEKAAWGVEAVGANASGWDAKDVIVAVLDTGIDAKHEAFLGVRLVEKDFTGAGNGDLDGHGTHCAGTIFGRGSAVRYGVAPSVSSALIGKVLDNNGEGTTKSISQGIYWALTEGAHIITMSFGIDFPEYVRRLVKNKGLPIEQATSKALQAYRETIRFFDKLTELATLPGPFGPGAIIIAAAGNESERAGERPFELTVSPPAAASGVVAVAALERPKAAGKPLKVASFSNTDATVAAPGVDILSAKAGGGYQSMSGTSMAAPHVAGVSALWAAKLMSEKGGFDPARLRGFLIGTARNSPKWDKADVGAGLVQAPPSC